MKRRRRAGRSRRRRGMSSVHTNPLTSGGTRLHRYVRCRGAPIPSRENRVRQHHCADASRAATPAGAPRSGALLVCLACRRRHHPVVAGAVSLLPPRALGPRCTSPHPKPGGACQARRGRATFIAVVCPRTLALGTCHDRRSRVSPARSLFSSQTTSLRIRQAR